MTTESLARLDERKAHLVTQAHLDRARLMLAIHQVRMIVSPPPDPARSARLRPTVSMLLNIALPLLGFRRASRVVRLLSYALTAIRVASNWHGSR